MTNAGGRYTVLIAYDIRDPARLRKVHKAVSNRAFALQYSLYIADLDEKGLEEMKMAISKQADPSEDDVRIYRLRADVIGAWQGPLPIGGDEGVDLFGSPAATLARRLRENPWKRDQKRNI